jgi:hypothetical protein
MRGIEGGVIALTVPVAAKFDSRLGYPQSCGGGQWNSHCFTQSDVSEDVAVEDLVKSLLGNARLMREAVVLLSNIVPGRVSTGCGRTSD